jgi:ABC-type phosphate transport system auxiliary subunit
MSSDKQQRPRRLRSKYSSLTAHGEPWVWLTGGALALAIMMITGLLAFIAFQSTDFVLMTSICSWRLEDMFEIY